MKYVDFARWLAREELLIFTHGVTGRVDVETLRPMAEAGITLVNQIIALLRKATILRYVAEGNVPASTSDAPVASGDRRASPDAPARLRRGAAQRGRCACGAGKPRVPRPGDARGLVVRPTVAGPEPSPRRTQTRRRWRAPHTERAPRVGGATGRPRDPREEVQPDARRVRRSTTAPRATSIQCGYVARWFSVRGLRGIHAAVIAARALRDATAGART